MTAQKKKELIQFVADLAAEQLHHFEPTERAYLYEALALLYTGDKAEVCKLAAFTIRKAEQHQLKFRELLRS